jgi:uncharacterized protein (TIGR03067 family)
MRGARLSWFIGSLLAVLVATRVAAQDAGSIQGAWTVVSAERDAKATTEVAGHRLTFSGDTFAIQHEGHSLFRGTYKVDTSRKPAVIDFLHSDGNLKGKSWKGIYRFDGETLRICDNALDTSKPRPTQFSAKAGSGYICIVFKRATG